jgi:Uma2 family endonuclease
MTVQRRPPTSTHRINGANRTAAAKPVVYPTSDGKPMAETDLHRQEMVRLIDTLDDHFAGDGSAYVSGNMLLYYEEGNPRASIAPDVFVVPGIARGPREIYKLWEEGKPPALIIEVTSKTTRREDQRKKRELYARLGVPEYVMYDPLGDYLDPPLHGFRLRAGVYAPVPETATGGIESAIGVTMRLIDGRLLFDQASGVRLLSPHERAVTQAARAETEARRAEAEARRADGEAQRAEAESRRADEEAEARRAAEAENARLRALLRERGIQ